MNNRIRIKYKWLLPALLIIITQSGCKKYLEEVPDKSLTVPQSLTELQGLLDNPELNEVYPIAGVLAADNLYLPTEDWNYIFTLDERLAYIWDKDANMSKDWLHPYKRVFISNVALDALADFDEYSKLESYRNIRGSALFYRSIMFYELAQLFAPPYSADTGNQSYGIPLKTSSDIAEITSRSTVKETYDKIISDLKESLTLLPDLPLHATRPSKAASYALLARTYLMMNDYSNAEKYADSSLQLKSDLIDFNDGSQVNPNAESPFKRLNKEVIFHAVSRNMVEMLRSKVNINLVNSFDSNDIRKNSFFSQNTDNTYHFKGSYDGTLTVVFFSGILTSEMYLIRAECRARRNLVNEALIDLNLLLAHRWVSGTFTPVSAVNAQDALAKILNERRKELCFNGSLRWSDLRRLNQDANTAIDLVKEVNGQTYTLPAKDKRYTFLIPEEVIDRSGITQNPR